MFTKHERRSKRLSSVGTKIRVALFAVVVIFSVANLIGVIANVYEKNAEVDLLNSQIEQQQQDIEEVSYLLENGNELEYIERIARENYGYAAPGERAFYVSDGG